MKTFIHQFKNGLKVKVWFDLSKDIPLCQSDFKLTNKPASIQKEYRFWMDTVVIPELLTCMTPAQIKNMSNHGFNQIT